MSVNGAVKAERSPLALDGRVRLAFVLFGGMVALQSSPTLDTTKVAYLIGVVLCLLAALVAVWKARRTPEVRLGLPWLVISAALTALIGMSLLVARAEGTPSIDWVRDVSAYALFAAVPVYALDAQSSTARKVLVMMLVISGFLGGLGWSVEWLGRREVLELPIERLVFPSGQLPGMLYLFAMATALSQGLRNTRWAVLGGVILGLFLLTGTRSSLLLLVGPLAMVALAGRDRIRSSFRAMALQGIVAVALVVVFQLALALPVLLASNPTPPPTTNVVGDRFWSLPGVISDPGSDASLNERLAQYEAASALFVSSPFLGVGPGHAIEWIDISGRRHTEYTADTPLVMPAKFGLLGVLVFLGGAVAYGLTVRTALLRHRRSGITLTLVGYGVWTIVGLPLGFTFEDKGASLALMLLLALAFTQNAESPSIDDAPVDQQGWNVIEGRRVQRVL